MQNTNADCIDALMEKSRAHLAVPVDTKQAAAVKAQPSEDKTQSSSMPTSPKEKPVILPPPMPSIKINLDYSQVDEVAKSVCYLKHVPTVYIDHPNFDFSNNDFELRVRDKAFLREVEISEKDFERCIDCFEKIAFMYRDTQPTFVA